MALLPLATGGTHGGSDRYAQPPLPQQQPETVRQFKEGTIVFTRPLHELWAHIADCELPSWTLIARAISTLFMAIFRWHLCDGIMLIRGEGVYHSFDGAVATIPFTGRQMDDLTNVIRPYCVEAELFPLEPPTNGSVYHRGDLDALLLQYPYITNAALCLRCRDNTPVTQNPAKHDMKNLILKSDSKTQTVAIPSFDKYPEISAQTCKILLCQRLSSRYHRP